MADILRFPGTGKASAEGETSVRYVELANCSDIDAPEGFRVVVAKRDDDLANLHLVLIGENCVENLGSYSLGILSLEACRAVGEIASRAISRFWISLPDDGGASPRGARLSEASFTESRATILAETLKCASTIVGDFTESELFCRVAAPAGLTEEEFGAEIRRATYCLIRNGLIESGDYDALTGGMRFRATTRLRISPAISAHMHSGEIRGAPDDGGSHD